MSVYQLLECHIMLGGDMQNVVHRHQFNPVTFPELIVLRYIHGTNSVTDVYDVGAIDREDDVEMQRLRETYTDEVIKAIYPGSGVRLPNGDNRYKPRIVSPDKELPLTPPKPEVVHPPGTIDFEAQGHAQAEAEFVPSATPKPDDEADPFEGTAAPAPATPRKK